MARNTRNSMMTKLSPDNALKYAVANYLAEVACAADVKKDYARAWPFFLQAAAVLAEIQKTLPKGGSETPWAIVGGYREDMKNRACYTRASAEDKVRYAKRR